MSAAGVMLLAIVATLPAQTDRRPVITVTAEDAQVVDLTVRWRSLTDPAGVRYPQYAWEARSFNELLAAETVTDTTTVIRILRPSPPDSHLVRIYVRGVGPDGPGPWGWASEPLVVRGAAPASREPGPALPRAAEGSRRGGSHEPDVFHPLGGRRFATRAQTPADGGDGPGAFPTGGAEGFDPIEHRFAALTITADPDAPISPPAVLRVAFENGAPGGRAPALLRTDSARWHDVQELYARYAFRLGETFTLTPLFDARLFGYDLDWNLGVVDMIVGVGRGRYQYQTALHGTRPPCQRERGYPATGPAGMIDPGRWYIVEVLLTPGAPGACNGTLQVWIDGRSVIDQRRVGLGTSGTAALAFRRVRFEPIWEVNGRRTPRPFTVDLDDVYLSGR